MAHVLSTETDVNTLVHLVVERTAVQGRAALGGHGRRADLGDTLLGSGAGGGLDGVLDVALGVGAGRGSGGEGEEAHCEMLVRAVHVGRGGCRRTEEGGGGAAETHGDGC